ncbi:MAG: hypothetical protein GX241_04420 [Ruminococcaceae bacterium]|nr:hypothetical protein [Oscillospiraceae bacterium]
MLALIMALSLVACKKPAVPAEPDQSKAPVSEQEKPASEAPEDAPEIKDVTGKFEVAEFKIKVNGKELKTADFKDCSVYKIATSAVNKTGTVKEDTYSGYAIKDVLKVAGAPDATKITVKASDGYEVDFEITEENAPYILLAFEKNKEVAEDGTLWVAPCLEKVTQNYCKSVVEIIVK